MQILFTKFIIESSASNLLWFGSTDYFITCPRAKKSADLSEAVQ